MSKVAHYRYLEPETLARLGKLNLIARAIVEGFIAGLHRALSRGFSVEFSEHREYVPGDNPRDLDWLVLARTDRCYVKQYAEETNLRAYILLDASASMNYRHGPDRVTKLEYGCYLAAALAFLMRRQQYPVGLVTFDEGIRRFLPPRSSTPHLTRLLQALEVVKPGKCTSLGETFHELAQRIKRRGLRHFRHKKHEVLLFHVLDAAELTFPFERPSEFVDIETGEKLYADPTYMREEYLRNVHAFVDSCRRECANANVDYVIADTSTPYDLLLRAYLSKRKRFG